MKKLINSLEKIIDFTQIILLSIIVGSIGVQILSRKLFNRPFAFPEELSMFTLIAIVFIGIIVIERHGEHIKLEFICNKFSFFKKKGMKIFEKLLIFLIVFAILLGEWQTVPRIIYLKSKAAGIPYIWIHSIIIISCVIWAFIIIVDIVNIMKNEE
jgi:TRAP-type C4-dicarboxylate transport system permease small subunit